MEQKPLSIYCNIPLDSYVTEWTRKNLYYYIL
jgi:hypothetical protein